MSISLALMMAVVWGIAALVVVPWFVIAFFPFLLAPALVGGTLATPALVLAAWSEHKRLARATQLVAAPAVREALRRRIRVFVPSSLGVDSARVEALVARYLQASGEAAEACSCLVRWKGRCVLTVQLRRPDACVSHQVHGRTPEEALARMASKLEHEAQRWRTAPAEVASHAPHRPWCLARTICPSGGAPSGPPLRPAHALPF